MMKATGLQPTESIVGDVLIDRSPVLTSAGDSDTDRWCSPVVRQEFMDDRFPGKPLPAKGREMVEDRLLRRVLCSLLRKELTAKGITLSIDAMLESLGSIREVHMMLRSPGPGRPRTQSTHSELDPLAARLFEALDLASMLPS